LNSEKGTKAERKWPELIEAPGDEVVRLCAVRVKTKEGLITDAFDIRRPVGIEMEYEVLQPGYVLGSRFHVLNEEGIYLFISLDNEPTWRGRLRQPGRYVSTAWIPGNLLSEGQFYIAASMRNLDPSIRRFRVDDAVAFQVVDSMDGDAARVGSGGNMPGVVRPLLKWETEFSPNGNSIATETMTGEANSQIQFHCVFLVIDRCRCETSSDTVSGKLGVLCVPRWGGDLPQGKFSPGLTAEGCVRKRY